MKCHSVCLLYHVTEYLLNQCHSALQKSCKRGVSQRVSGRAAIKKIDEAQVRVSDNLLQHEDVQINIDDPGNPHMSINSSKVFAPLDTP